MEYVAGANGVLLEYVAGAKLAKGVPCSGGLLEFA